METHSKEIRGLHTAWFEDRKENGKPVVLFLHGCPDDPHIWQAQLDHFNQQGYSTVAPWARGVGESAPSKERSRYGLDAIALDHLEILRTLDPSAKHKVIVVAHDIGGVHAWHLARLLGDRLAALILLNAPELTQMARRLTQWSQLKKSWYIGFFQIPLLPEFLLKKGRLHGREMSKITPFLGQYREAARAIPDAFKQDPQLITAPVLVLWGNRDAFLNTPSQDELNRLAENATIRVLDGGHWIQSEKPERVNALIGSFLSEIVK